MNSPTPTRLQRLKVALAAWALLAALAIIVYGLRGYCWLRRCVRLPRKTT